MNLTIYMSVQETEAQDRSKVDNEISDNSMDGEAFSRNCMWKKERRLQQFPLETFRLLDVTRSYISNILILTYHSHLFISEWNPQSE